MIFVQSLTCGIRAQIFRIEAKIRAFLAAGTRGGDVMGRNSATGSPRRSITIVPPSEASRTNSEVWMWSSRTEVFLIMLHCSTRFCPGAPENGNRKMRLNADSKANGDQRDLPDLGF